VAWEPDYCTTEDLADYIRVADHNDDAQLAIAVTAASRAVDYECRRQFGQSDLGPRVFSPRIDGWSGMSYSALWLYGGPPATSSARRGRWTVVDVDDIQDTTGMTVATDNDGDGVFETDVTSYVLHPRNAAQKGSVFNQVLLTSAPMLPDSVQVTALFGWSQVPTAIVQATLIQAARFMARRDSPYGVTGSPDNGGELRLLSKVDPDVAVMLRPYRRKWWAI
jgi:hypothetical protein